MASKWENFLKNLGEWRGSFTRISNQGEILDSTPSIINLESFEDNTLVKFRVRRFGPQGYDAPPTKDQQQDYRSLGRQVLFFETGAFSKGSLQLAPYSSFGAEYGFVDGDRRLRLVQLFDEQNQFETLTLIREFRQGTAAAERPPLAVEQLLGVWEGQACTIEADWQEPSTQTSRLEIRQPDAHHLVQTLSFSDRKIESVAKIMGNQLLFDQGEQPRQILLLPDGASSNLPLKLQHRTRFFLEAGWLITPKVRQRLIRHYDASGAWTGATHVIEQKQ